MTWRHAVAPALVLAISAGTLFYRLGEPPFRESPEAPLHYVFDEVYWAFSAHRAAIGDPDTWKPRAKRAEMMRADPTDLSINSAYLYVHPPIAILIMASTIGLWGWGPVGARLSSAVFGLLTLFFTWLLANRIRPGFFAAAATALVATDGVFFVLSRTAMSNIHGAAFDILALYAMLRFWTDAKRGRWLVLAGASLGCSFAIKWSVAGLAAGLGLIALGRIAVGAALRGRRGRLLASDLACWIAGFAVAPPAIYVLSYLPYFFWWHHSWADFTEMQRQGLALHRFLPATFIQSSPWYSWPLMTRPVLMYLGESAHPQPEELDRFVFCVGNPLLWWAFLPALGYLIVRWLRTRQPGDAFILCGFFGSWLPWALSPRFTFFHHMLPSVPLGALAVAVMLDDLQKHLKLARPWLLFDYAVLCIVSFIHFYPVWAAVPIPRALALDGRYLNLADSDLIAGRLE